MSRPAGQLRVALTALLLVSLTLGLYCQVFRHEFVNYDDQEYVTQNPLVSAGLTARGVVWAVTTVHAANWHPLTWLSHMLDCQFFGLRPGWHHLTSVGLHAANAVLLLLLLRRLTGALWRSAVVAALFALHPLRVESVAWVAERKDVLSAWFGLLALWAYVVYAQKRAGEPVGKWEGGKTPTRPLSHFLTFYGLALAFFACGLLSKPMLVTLPFVMLLLDYWPLRRVSGVRCEVSGRDARDADLTPRTPHLALLAEKLPFLALGVASSILTLFVQKRAMWEHARLSWELRFANAVVAYVRYLGKTFWPADLAVPYPHPGHWPAGQVVGAALLLALVSIGAVWQRRRRPWLLVGWLWFVGMLAPVIGLVQVGAQSMADRYTYLPLIGIFIGLVWLVAEWLGRIKGAVVVAASLGTAVLLACAVRTWQQTRVWKDTETLFAHAVAVTRGNWVAHYNLALLALDRYQRGSRATLTGQRLESSPGSARPPGGPLAERDYLGEVVFHCQAAVEAHPVFADPRITLAKALTEQGQLEAARTQLEIAVRLDPKNPDARQNLGEIHYRNGRAAEARREYEAALALKPDWESVLNNLAWLLATHRDADVRDGAKSVQLAERACALSGHTNFWFLQTLAAAYAEAGRFTEAVETSVKARQLALAAGLSNLAARADARLRLYRAGQACRE